MPEWLDQWRREVWADMPKASSADDPAGWWSWWAASREFADRTPDPEKWRMVCDTHLARCQRLMRAKEAKPPVGETHAPEGVQAEAAVPVGSEQPAPGLPPLQEHIADFLSHLPEHKGKR